MPLTHIRISDFFYQCLGRNNQQPLTRPLSSARTPWQEKIPHVSATGAARHVERYSSTHPAGNVECQLITNPAGWSTSSLRTRSAKLTGRNLSKQMDWARWSYSLATALARTFMSRFLFVGTAEGSYLWDSHWICRWICRQAFSRCRGSSRCCMGSLQYAWRVSQRLPIFSSPLYCVHSSCR